MNKLQAYTTSANSHTKQFEGLHPKSLNANRLRVAKHHISGEFSKSPQENHGGHRKELQQWKFPVACCPAHKPWPHSTPFCLNGFPTVFSSVNLTSYSHPQSLWPQLSSIFSDFSFCYLPGSPDHVRTKVLFHFYWIKWLRWSIDWELCLPPDVIKWCKDYSGDSSLWRTGVFKAKFTAVLILDLRLPLSFTYVTYLYATITK